MPLCLVSSGNIAALALWNSCSDLSEFTNTVGLWQVAADFIGKSGETKIPAKMWFDCIYGQWSGEVTAMWSQNVVPEG